jgi:hypothetical protein
MLLPSFSLTYQMMGVCPMTDFIVFNVAHLSEAEQCVIDIDAKNEADNQCTKEIDNEWN